jgi:hypothetical protein
LIDNLYFSIAYLGFPVKLQTPHIQKIASEHSYP